MPPKKSGAPRRGGKAAPGAALAPSGVRVGYPALRLSARLLAPMRGSPADAALKRIIVDAASGAVPLSSAVVLVRRTCPVRTAAAKHELELLCLAERASGVVLGVAGMQWDRRRGRFATPAGSADLEKDSALLHAGALSAEELNFVDALLEATSEGGPAPPVAALGSVLGVEAATAEGKP
jgi:hypothetical protein